MDLFARHVLDIEAFHAGRGDGIWRVLGAHACRHDGEEGFRFAVWAPAARAVAVIGDFCEWHPAAMHRRDDDIWALFIPGVKPGQCYKFQVTHAAGQVQDKADPYARATEVRPATASKTVGPSRFKWSDAAWMRDRGGVQHRGSAIAIYELHLASWIRHVDGSSYGFREIAPRLIDHVQRFGFSHVEFLPLAEYPYDPSWGYQVTGYFAPTSRHGSPDDLRYLIDRLHAAGIGVLVDWVPAHFPRDGHGLGRFDGSPLYEHANPQRGEHPDWGTLIFDYAKPGVRSFLLANAGYWLSEFHFDGFRVDAVASMLYLDYSRGPAEWSPNVNGGNWNLEAIRFLQDVNEFIHGNFPGVMTVAEESTAFPMVTGPVADGGLGFSYKWNMGWMHDTLKYFKEDPIHRTHHHDTIAFPVMYAFTEAFVLPLSHDEVVHLKGSLIRKMGGFWAEGLAQLKLLYGHQWTHPGKKLLFMGQELAQDSEWNFDGEIAWGAAADPGRQALQRWLRALNDLYRSHPALHAGDCDPTGFRWVEGRDARHSILVFERIGDGREVVVVLHFTPENLTAHWVPMPSTGPWRILLHSDDLRFGGDTQPPEAALACHEAFDRPFLHLDLPGYTLIVLEAVP